MNVLVIYAHPYDKSFNHAILDATLESLKASGAEVRLRDLYAMNFTGTLSASDLQQMYQLKQIPKDIEEEQKHWYWAQRVIFIYPLWWFERPAILKGYCDRVFTNGFAFRYSEKGAEGLLKQDKAMVLITTGTPEKMLQPVEKVLPVAMRDGTLKFCGIKEVVWHTFYGVLSVAAEQRKSMLEQVKKATAQFVQP